MRLDRIHIIGGPGCGKTYTAEKLAELTNIQRIELDDIFWCDDYNTKTDREERIEKLKKVIKKKRWIIEGVFHSWTKPAFEKADLIILIKCKRYLRTIRILKRALKRQFQKDCKKDNLSSIISFLIWNHKWDSNDFLRIKDALKGYNKKIKMFTKADKAIEFIKEKLE